MKKLVKAVAVLGLAAAMALPLAACGEAGKSAYDIAVEHGFVGTEEEWLESLRGPQGEQGEKGDKGDKGEQGDAGAPGAPGATPSITINEDGYWVINGEVTDVKAEGQDGEDGKDGQDGASGPMGPTGPAGVGIDSIATEIVDDGSGNFTTVITIILTNGTEYSFNLPGAAVSSGQEYEAGSSELFAELVKGGATSITLTDNVEVGEVLKISQDLTLDLNGKTLTVGSGIADGSAALRVEAGGKLTIDGNGIIDATNALDGVVPVAAMGEDALVTVEGGTIKVDTPEESCLYAMYGGKVVVNGGTFENNSTTDYAYGGGAPLTVNVSNSYNVTDIVINGGTFKGRDPALGDDNKGGTFVGDSYVSVPRENNTYTIVESDEVDRATYPVIAGTGAFKTLPDAVKAFMAEKAPLANGALVVDLAAGTNYSLEGLSVVRGDVTLRGAGADSTTLTLTAAKSGQAGLEVAADGLTVQDMTIALASNVGDGNTSVIKPLFKADDPVEGLKLSGLTLKGNDKGHGINLHNVKNAVVENVTIEGYGKNGIAIASATGVKISGVQFNDTTAWADIGLMYADNTGKTIGTTAGEWYRTPVTGVKIGEGNKFGMGVVYSDITPAFAKTVTDYSGVTAEDMYDVAGMEAYGYVPVVVEKDSDDVQLQYLPKQTVENADKKPAAAVNGVYYQTLEKALAEAEDGATITLNADVTMTQALTFNKDVTLDLGGKQLTLYSNESNKSTNSISGGAQVIIQKGHLIGKQAGNAKLAFSNIQVSGAETSLTLESVIYTADGTAIYIQGDGSTEYNEETCATVKVSNSTINTSGGFGIGTNATAPDGVNQFANVNIVVDRSTITSIGSGILLNVAGNLTVTNSTIKADEQGVFVRAGNATISNSTLGTTYAYTQEQLIKLNEAWGDGNYAPQAALVVGNRNGTYCADATCTLSGGIKFEIAENSAVPKIYVYDGTVDVTAAKYETTLNYEEGTGITVTDIVIGNGSGAVTINEKEVSPVEEPSTQPEA